MNKACCYDCGRPYGESSGFADLVVPEKISPTGGEGGLLCPSCMVRRCHERGITCPATWRSGPFCEPGNQGASE